MNPSQQDAERHWKKQLIWEYDLLCAHYRLQLVRPLLQIDESSRFWGQYDPNTRTLTLHRHLIEQYRWDDVIEVLKHEMAHQIVFEHFQSNDHTHGPLFQKACDILHMAPWAMKATGDIGDALKADLLDHELDTDEHMLRKARKLLALSQSDNEHEALLAMQRLQQLSQRYNIDQLLARRQQSYRYSIINHQKKRIPQHQSYIASILQKHFFVDIVFSTEYDAQQLTSYKTMEILGSQENVVMAEYIYHYLWNQLPRMWKRHRQAGAMGKQAKRAYLLGVLESFDEKLAMQQKEKEKSFVQTNTQQWQALAAFTHPQGALAKARAELTAFVRRRHPRLRTTHWQLSHDQWDSYRSGRKDGKHLDIHPGLQNQGSQAKNLLLQGSK
ncbi:MAG: SprT-like domain-containing protein [Oligoflexus sp.]